MVNDNLIGTRVRAFCSKASENARLQFPKLKKQQYS
jgi:hypothetical protein